VTNEGKPRCNHCKKIVARTDGIAVVGHFMGVTAATTWETHYFTAEPTSTKRPIRNYHLHCIAEILASVIRAERNRRRRAP